MADSWNIDAWDARNKWVTKDRAYDERIALTMFMARASAMPNMMLRLMDNEGTLWAERNVDKAPR